MKIQIIKFLDMGMMGMGMNFVAGQMAAEAADNRQIKMQKQLNDMTMVQNRAMTNYNMEKQMQMWEQTGWGAQMEQMKAAGLNPALMYGKGGMGGSTQVNASHQAAPEAPKGGGEAIAMMGMGLQLQLQKAQIEATKAQANKTNVEATKIGGVDTDKTKTEIENIAQNTNNQKAQEQLTKVQTDLNRVELWIKDKSKEDAAEIIMWKANEMVETVQRLHRENMIGNETQEETIQIVKKSLVQLLLQNDQIAAQTGLTKEQTKKITEEIALIWKQYGIDQQNANANERNAQTNFNKWGLESQIRDIPDSEKLPNELISNIISILLLKNIMGGIKPNEVKGFKR